MRLSVNPNRMELIKLRRRLALAFRGHKLLEDKLEQLMSKFLRHIQEARALNSKVKEGLAKIIPLFIISQAKMSRQGVEKALDMIKVEKDFDYKENRIMNLRTPEIAIKRLELTLNYGFDNTSAELDIAALRLKDIFADLIKLAQLFKTCQILCYEIERTRRRVNALKYLLIPSIIETITFIEDKLSEYERQTLVRLMRVKEIVRSH